MWTRLLTPEQSSCLSGCWEETCPEFGDGWTRRSRQRPGTSGHMHHAYVSPTGKTFRSRKKVVQHLGLASDPGSKGGLREEKRKWKVTEKSADAEKRAVAPPAALAARAAPAPLPAKQRSPSRVHALATPAAQCGQECGPADGSQDGPPSLLGRRVRVHFKGFGAHEGAITDVAGEVCLVVFDDGDQRKLGAPKLRKLLIDGP